MPPTRIPAVYMRGGSGNAVVFHERDLPAEQAARDAIFLHVLGSPDPYRRQLNGLGGGYSSVSKVVIIGPSARPASRAPSPTNWRPITRRCASAIHRACLPVKAEVIRTVTGQYKAVSATTYRTQPRIMEGHVLVPVNLNRR